MIYEEYCSYILSRNNNLKDFTIPGSNVTIDKSELITNMRTVVQGNAF